jgi:hypothetical protein
VVVSDSEGAAIVPKNAVEDLPYRKRRAVDGALCHCFRPSKMVAGIADEHQDVLAAPSGQFQPASREHVVRALKLDIHGPLVSHETTQPERGDQCRGLRLSDPLAPCQLFRSRGGEASKAAVLGEERRGQVEGTLTPAPVSEHQGKELPLGQCLHSSGEQPLSRSLVLGNLCDQDGHVGLPAREG